MQNANGLESHEGPSSYAMLPVCGLAAHELDQACMIDSCRWDGMQYPELMTHWEKIKSLPEIEKYLQSDKRYPFVLGSNVITDDKVIPERVTAKKQPVESFQKRMAGKK